MAEFTMPEFTINTSTANEDIFKLMKIIKPHWKELEIEIKVLTGGYSCILYRVSSKSENEAVILRIRNLFADKDIAGLDREFEKKTVQYASKLGLFPKIHAIFENGYCYDYVEGNAIYNVTAQAADVKTSFDFENLPYRLIARKFAEIHCIKLDNEDYTKTKFFTSYREMLNNMYSDIPNPLLVNKEIIQREFNEMESYAKKFQFNIVLCHGDPHPGNIVWNKENNTVSFMDWELAHIGPQEYDVGYFLTTLTDAGKECNEDIAERIKKDFLQFYLEEYSALNKFVLSEEYCAEFSRRVKFCSLMLCVNGSIAMGALIEESSRCPNWESISQIGINMFDHYISIKDRTLNELNLKHS